MVTPFLLHDDLMERVLDSKNMQRAWKRVKANKGAPGIEGMAIEDFTAFVREHWPAIHEALCDGRWQLPTSSGATGRHPEAVRG